MNIKDKIYQQIRAIDDVDLLNQISDVLARNIDSEEIELGPEMIDMLKQSEAQFESGDVVDH